jgi:hypothetical protein
MALTAAQLLADQAYLFDDFPRETVTIGGVSYECLVPRAENRNDWEMGGLNDMPRVTVLIDRNDLTTAPEQGGIAAFRGGGWRVATVRHDFPQAPITIELEAADLPQGESLMSGAGQSILTGAGLPILKGEP